MENNNQIQFEKQLDIFGEWNSRDRAPFCLFFIDFALVSAFLLSRSEPDALILRFFFSSDSKSIVAESAPPPQPVQDSCEESDEEWNYMKAKEGQTEKENNVLSEEFKENIEPVTEKEFTSVELKEQLDTAPGAATLDILAPIPIAATPEPVSPVVDDVSKFFFQLTSNWNVLEI